VDRSSLNYAIRELKTIDPKSVSLLRVKLRAGLAPVVAKIQADVPKEAPLSGMNSRGGTKWKHINKPKVEFTPGFSKKRTNSLLRITVTGGKNKLGFDYAELAGIRRLPGATVSKPYTRRVKGGGRSREMTHRVTGQGDAFIRGLNADKPIRGKAGRYAYDSFLSQKPFIVETSRKIINDLMASYNNKFRV